MADYPLTFEEAFQVSLGEHATTWPTRASLEEELASEKATNAELRRQLAGVNALLAIAQGRMRAVRDFCQRQHDWGAYDATELAERIQAALSA